MNTKIFKRFFFVISITIGMGIGSNLISNKADVDRYDGEMSLDRCEEIASAFAVKLRDLTNSHPHYGVNGDEQVDLISISDTNNCFFVTKSPSTGEVRPWSAPLNEAGSIRYVYEFESLSNHVAVNLKDRVFYDLRKL